MSDGDEGSGDDESSGNDADPFTELDDAREREGDPFEQLDTDAREPATTDDAGSDGPDPFEYIGAADDPDRAAGTGATDDADRATGTGAADDADAEGDPDTVPDPGPRIPEDPFDDYETPGEDPFDPETGPFDAAGDETVDPDVVWDRLASDPDGTAGGSEDVTDVSKHDFCERCEYFSPPPDIECSHEGTEIVEFRDMETVRLIDCPVVSERRRLGGLEE